MKTISNKILNEIKKIAKECNLGIDFSKENAIENFINKLDWYDISIYQKLSKEFIREFKDKVDWVCISIYQKLSEGFIREFQDKVNWHYILQYQRLSEDFIREFQDKVDWYRISMYQRLSELLIEEFKDKIPYFSKIAQYQKVSKAFINKYNISISNTCWLYKNTQYKIDYIKNNTPYEVIDNSYIIAYKSADKNGKSLVIPRYKYLPGRSYTSSCDYNIEHNNSFGLAAWTKKGALEYCNFGKLFKVLIFVKDIGAITADNKIRCRKLTVLSEEKK